SLLGDSFKAADYRRTPKRKRQVLQFQSWHDCASRSHLIKMHKPHVSRMVLSEPLRVEGLLELFPGLGGGSIGDQRIVAGIFSSKKIVIYHRTHSEKYTELFPAADCIPVGDQAGGAGVLRNNIFAVNFGNESELAIADIE